MPNSLTIDSNNMFVIISLFVCLFKTPKTIYFAFKSRKASILRLFERSASFFTIKISVYQKFAYLFKPPALTIFEHFTIQIVLSFEISIKEWKFYEILVNFFVPFLIFRLARIFRAKRCLNDGCWFLKTESSEKSSSSRFNSGEISRVWHPHRDCTKTTNSSRAPRNKKSESREMEVNVESVDSAKEEVQVCLKCAIASVRPSLSQNVIIIKLSLILN